MLYREGSEHVLYCSGICTWKPFGDEHEQRELEPAPGRWLVLL